MDSPCGQPTWTSAGDHHLRWLNLQEKVGRGTLDLELSLDSYSGAPRGSRASPGPQLGLQRNVTNLLKQERHASALVRRTTSRTTSLTRSRTVPAPASVLVSSSLVSDAVREEESQLAAAIRASLAEQAIDQARLAESDRDGPTGGRSRSRTSAGHSMRPHVTRPNPRAESAYLSEVM